MTDWKEGVQHGIAEMETIIKKHNALIDGIDAFLKVANKLGWADLVLDDLQRTKSRLQSDIVELNEQIEKQKIPFQC